MLTSLLCCLLLSDGAQTPAPAQDQPPAAANTAPLQPTPVPQGQGTQGQGPVAPNAAGAEAKPFPVDSFLKQFDSDGDGRLSPTELPRRFSKKFAETDLDHDGFLTAQEMLFANNRIGRQAQSRQSPPCFRWDGDGGGEQRRGTSRIAGGGRGSPAARFQPGRLRRLQRDQVRDEQSAFSARPGSRRRRRSRGRWSSLSRRAWTRSSARSGS